MSSSIPSGTTIGRFRVEAEVGRGGMGVVYRCNDPTLNRKVAIKLLASHLGSDPHSLARFRREAEAVAGLKHPHIALVYEFGEYLDQPYFAMEWVEGRTLKQILDEEGPLPLERVRGMAAQLAQALDYAHARGVIHRDLKPANIIIGDDDSATIVDFGLAWLDEAASITATGLILGTPRYMSPEQIRGDQVDRRTDLYSLAVILYEMLAGRAPFNTPNSNALLHQKMHTPPAPISEWNPSLPVTVERALSVGLAIEPEERFLSGGDLYDALSSPVEIRSPARRRRSWPVWLRWGAAIALAVGLIFLGIYFSPELIALIPSPEEESSLEETATNPRAGYEAPTPGSENILKSPRSDSWWFNPGGNPYHANYGGDQYFPLGEEARWDFYPDFEGGTELVGGAGVIIFGAKNGVVYGLDWASGGLLWESRVGAAIAGPLALFDGWDDDVVYISTEDAELYALSLHDARLLWRAGNDTLQGVARGVTVGYDGLVYALSDGGWLHVLDPYSGDVYASMDLSGLGEFEGVPTVTDIAIYLAGVKNIIKAFDLSTHELAWSTETQGQVTTPIVAAEPWSILLAGTRDGWVQAFSMLTGDPVWEIEIGNPITGLAYDWDHIYIAAEGGLLTTWNGWNEETAWTLELESEITAGPVTLGEVVYMGTEDGEVRFFLTESGEEIEGIYLDESVNYTPIPLGGWLFLRSDDAAAAFAPAELPSGE